MDPSSQGSPPYGGARPKVRSPNSCPPNPVPSTSTGAPMTAAYSSQRDEVEITTNNSVAPPATFEFPQSDDDQEALIAQGQDGGEVQGGARPRRRLSERILSLLTSCYSSPRSSRASSERQLTVQDPHALTFSPQTTGLVPVRQFFNDVLKLGGNAITRQFTQIDAMPLIYSYHEFKKSRNRDLNRVLDVVCYDHTRVKIQHGSNSTNDYYHASYVDGYKRGKGYILCQAPRQLTCQDFWNMVWQEGSCVIVKLASLAEMSKQDSYKYYPKKGEKPYSIGFYVISNRNAELKYEYTINTLMVQNTEIGVSRTVYQLEFLDWPYGAVPQRDVGVLELIASARQCQKNGTSKLGKHWTGHPEGPPVVVHCLNGVGRAGAYACIDICRSMIDDIGMLNIYEVVYRLKLQRAQAVTSEQQYMYIYKALLAYAQEKQLVSNLLELDYNYGRSQFSRLYS